MSAAPPSAADGTAEGEAAPARDVPRPMTGARAPETAGSRGGGWTKLAILAVVFVLGLAGVMLLLPMIARDRIIASAREAGINLTIDRVGIGVGGIALRGVTAKAQRVPTAELRADEIFAAGFSAREIRVRGLDELIETTECFVHAELPKGNRLAAVSLSGGKRGLLIDAFSSAGLNFAPLSTSASDKLAKMLGPGSIVGNPLDAGFAAVVDPSVYMQSIKIMIDDPETDIVIIDAELPNLPFSDSSFDLALSSHFLFLYSAQLSEAFHRAAIREMCRVAAEVRIFPLLALGAVPSLMVEPVMEELRGLGFGVLIDDVPYEFQRGGNKAIR
jgi:hypothetical protein